MRGSLVLHAFCSRPYVRKAFGARLKAHKDVLLVSLGELAVSGPERDGVSSPISCLTISPITQTELRWLATRWELGQREARAFTDDHNSRTGSVRVRP